MKIKCPAKVNLSLNVLGRLPNGYHELDMINCSVNLFDTIKLKLTKKPGIRIFSSSKDIPLDKSNSIYQAIEEFRKVYPFKEGVTAKLIKRIPSMSGLGGGTSDAAGVILGLNKLLRANLNLKQMTDIAIMVGSDVPYSLVNGFARIEGIGQFVTKIETKIRLKFLIVCPKEGIKTADCFQQSNLSNMFHPDIKKIFELVKDNKPEFLPFYLGNSLQKTAVSINPEIAQIINDLHHLHFPAVFMTGSGSGVIALAFQPKKFYRKAYRIFKKKHLKTFIVETIAY